MSVKETLTKARGVLIERGVNRDGNFVNSKNGCQVCALGAVKLAMGAEIQSYTLNDGSLEYDIVFTGPYSEFREAREVLENAIPEGEINWVPDYNDMSESDAQVLEIFDRAIASLED